MSSWPLALVDRFDRRGIQKPMATWNPPRPLVLVIRTHKNGYAFQIRGPGGGVVLQAAGAEFGSAAEARTAGERALAAYVANGATDPAMPPQGG